MTISDTPTLPGLSAGDRGINVLTGRGIITDDIVVAFFTETRRNQIRGTDNNRNAIAVASLGTTSSTYLCEGNHVHIFAPKIVRLLFPRTLRGRRFANEALDALKWAHQCLLKWWRMCNFLSASQCFDYVSKFRPKYRLKRMFMGFMASSVAA